MTENNNTNETTILLCSRNKIDEKARSELIKAFEGSIDVFLKHKGLISDNEVNKSV